MLTVFTILSVLFMIGWWQETDVSIVRADESDIGFRVNPVIPTNQEEKNASWFRLNLKSGDTQPLQMNVTNTLKKDITMKCVPTVAVTNPIGQVLYNQMTPKRDDTLQMDFTKIGPRPFTFKIPAGKTMVVTQVIKVPKTNFNGAVFGGFVFYSNDVNAAHQQSASSSKRGVSMFNQYQIVVATVLNINKAAEVTPDLRIDRVTPMAYRGNPAVTAQFHNTKPAVIEGQQMSFNARVYYRGGKKVLFRNVTNQMNFAPNSTIDYVISWGNTRMQPGNYTLRTKVTTGGAGPSWNLVKNFTITGNQADKLNKGTKRADYSWLIIFLIIAGLMLVAILIAWVYRAGKRSSVKNAGH
ncbi:hypothetical protein L248_2254 [Schleiferilactobacillus shenzhenensis LY-73]|uniref:Uncharacterized protein n=1 Tax=Schleiferilactobacillus shenzhenensis LY-73 TaxID=1231336 RepID=U4THR7_9LACO|nr:hypothetical protein L248_2254 [Schleiferilactobacillus shenzhenensis LY-73]